MRSPRVSRSLGGEERTVRRCSNVVTLLHKDRRLSRCDELSWISVGGLPSNLTSRRMVLALRRMLETSSRIELGQRWRGRLLLEGAGAALCGDMVVAMSIASPRIAWRVLVKSKTCVLYFVSFSIPLGGDGPGWEFYRVHEREGGSLR